MYRHVGYTCINRRYFLRLAAPYICIGRDGARAVIFLATCHGHKRKQLTINPAWDPGFGSDPISEWNRDFICGFRPISQKFTPKCPFFCANSHQIRISTLKPTTGMRIIKHTWYARKREKNVFCRSWTQVYMQFYIQASHHTGNAFILNCSFQWSPCRQQVIDGKKQIGSEFSCSYEHVLLNNLQFHQTLVP